MLLFSDLWIGSLEQCDLRITWNIKEGLGIKVKNCFPMNRKDYMEHYIATELVEINNSTRFQESTSRSELISNLNGWINDIELQDLDQIPEIANEREEDSEDNYELPSIIGQNITTSDEVEGFPLTPSWRLLA
jgi:hypothetical protein